jgi:hypothetical protein
MKWKVQIEIDRKRKKDPGLAIFSPTVFETGCSTVRHGKKLDDQTLWYTFQKGHQLAVIGTWRRAADEQECNWGLKQSVRASSFCHAVKPQKLTGIGNREGHEDDRCGFIEFWFTNTP